MKTLEQKITDYIVTHYGGNDTDVKKWDAKPLRQSTINSPFEEICGKTICMTWASPSHAGCRSAIYWNYVSENN